MSRTEPARCLTSTGAVDGSGRRQMLSAGRNLNAGRCHVHSLTDKIALMKGTAGRVASLLAVLGCSHGRAGDACAHGPGILQPLGPGSATIRTVFVIVMENTNWSEIAGNPSAPYINRTLLPAASFPVPEPGYARRKPRPGRFLTLYRVDYQPRSRDREPTRAPPSYTDTGISGVRGSSLR